MIETQTRQPRQLCGFVRGKLLESDVFAIFQFEQFYTMKWVICQDDDFSFVMI